MKNKQHEQIINDMSINIVTRILLQAGVDTITIDRFITEEIDVEALYLMQPSDYEEIEAEQYYGVITTILETFRITDFELQD